MDFVLCGAPFVKILYLTDLAQKLLSLAEIAISACSYRNGGKLKWLESVFLDVLRNLLICRTIPDSRNIRCCNQYINFCFSSESTTLQKLPSWLEFAYA